MDAPAAAGPVRVFDVLGRLRATIPGRHAGDHLLEYRLEERRGTLYETGRYWAMEPATGAVTSFFWPGRSGESR